MVSVVLVLAALCVLLNDCIALRRSVGRACSTSLLALSARKKSVESQAVDFAIDVDNEGSEALIPVISPVLRPIIQITAKAEEKVLSPEQLERRSKAKKLVNEDKEGKERAAAMFSSDESNAVFMAALMDKLQSRWSERISLLEKQDDELSEARRYESMSVSGRKEFDKEEEREERDVDDGDDLDI